MLDSDNVLLLHPSHPGGGFDLAGSGREGPAGVVTATIHYLNPELTPAFVAFFEARMRPGIETAGAAVLATFISETSPNTFPRLPIRTGDHVLAWFTRFKTKRAQRAFAERLTSDAGWRDAAPEALLPAFMRKPEILRLLATPRSRLR